ncbi:MAG: hypothetical protein II735_02860, partial [Clostridia bacterium]|nr:hypothetical protein [Clostridia bacterium]
SQPSVSSQPSVQESKVSVISVPDETAHTGDSTTAVLWVMLSVMALSAVAVIIVKEVNAHAKKKN